MAPLMAVTCRAKHRITTLIGAPGARAKREASGGSAMVVQDRANAPPWRIGAERESPEFKSTNPRPSSEIRQVPSVLVGILELRSASNEWSESPSAKPSSPSSLTHPAQGNLQNPTHSQSSLARIQTPPTYPSPAHSAPRPETQPWVPNGNFQGQTVLQLQASWQKEINFLLFPPFLLPLFFAPQRIARSGTQFVGLPA
ncbi:hypothetical protein DDE82_002323 [Stemphylium lycopersici]|nr:hypothetical protein DDE82_002323 [Stemphylium lycopersici]